MESEQSGHRKRVTAPAVAGLVSVLALAMWGWSSGSRTSSTSVSSVLGESVPVSVVVISVPGLRWQDLEATDTPRLDALLGASALLSVRALGSKTTLTEGYLTLNAGNRVSADGAAATLDDGRCVTSLVGAAAASADDDLNGAEPGAFGDLLAIGGIERSVFGSAPAIAALMDTDGCVDRYSAGVPATVPAGLTLVELDGLERTAIAAERSSLIVGFDQRLGSLGIGDDAVVFVVAPSAPNDAAEVTVAGLRRPAPAIASLSSPTTRRAGYVTLADLAPTVLELFEIGVPESMTGTAMVVVDADDADDADDAALASQVATFADLAQRVAFRDRAVGPVSVVLVVLLSLCAFAALGRRWRLARTLAPIVLAYPTVTFLMGLTGYHQLPLDFVVVAVVLVSAVLAAVVVSSTSTLGRWVPSAVLATLLWLVLVVDIVTGGRLQINTPLGYTPTIAGRFQGFGNLAFGLVASAAMVVAVLAGFAHRETGGRRGASNGGGGRMPRPVPWVVWVGGVTLVSVAAPSFGSDVGGTLSILPALSVVVMVMAGIRLSWRRIALAGAISVTVVVLLGLIDRARPSESRTHLGRFLDDLIHGDGGLVIRRKLRSNLAIMTSSFWGVVFVALLIAAAVAVWRRRAVVAALLGEERAMRAFLAGWCTVALLGFALNDSGIAVPAIMLTVALPWCVGALVAVVRRVPR